MNTKQKGSATTWIIVIVVILIVGGFYLWHANGAGSTSGTATVQSAPLSKSDDVSSIESDLQNTAPANVDTSSLN